MSDLCAWIITLGSNEAPAHAAAAQLGSYGLAPKGQRWPTEAQAWIASAQEAAQANAAIVIVVGSVEAFNDTATRRDLALFRLALQTRRQRAVNGIALLSGDATKVTRENGSAVLDDWLIATDSRWPAKAVARAHAPVAPAWPVRLGIHAQERLGVWLEVHPNPSQTASGALLGVSGNDAGISFHAVGSAGALPERTVNEYELQGLKFTAAQKPFDAWAVQNTLTPEQSYYVRLEGSPDWLAVGSLPNGEPDDVHLFRLG